MTIFQNSLFLRTGVIQSNQYYPFGMLFAESTSQDKQSFKYNGKELDQKHGLNQYDYSARYYDPAISRFTTIDPLAEIFYNWSPYVYVYNNPLKFIDPDGKRGRLPMRRGNQGGNRGGNRYGHVYPNGIRPNSITRVTQTSYHRKNTQINLEPLPVHITDFTTAGNTRVQITNQNYRGQLLATLGDGVGIMLEWKEKITNSPYGSQKSQTLDIKFNNAKTENEFNIKQNEYQNQFSSKLTELNNTSISENKGQLSIMDYITNMSSVIQELGISPKQQILNYLNQNKDNYNLEIKTKESEVTEWRQGY